MASSNYGSHVTLPSPSSANHLKSIGGQNPKANRDAKTYIGKTAVAPANIGNVGKIAKNAMGKNGTMQSNTVPKVKKLRKN